MREFRLILDNRNALLQNGHCDHDSYMIWTEKLWNSTQELQHMRIQALKELEDDSNALLYEHVQDDVSLTFSYQAKKQSDVPFHEFWSKHGPSLPKDEAHFKRSLFGAHLDDFAIHFKDEKWSD